MTFTYRCSIGKFDKDHKKGVVYAEYIMNDIRKSGMCGVDLLLGDGESALQSSPKHIRLSEPKYEQFRQQYLVPILIQAIADALHIIYNSMKYTAALVTGDGPTNDQVSIS
eukprot:313830_1